jgi:drug/metabolite transporter (DMT)-like permease
MQKSYLIAFFIATLFGAFLHFLFSLLPNAAAALFSPVAESLWEHLKLIFWPFLIASFFLTRRRPGGWGPHLFALLLSSGLMLLFGWLYHILLGHESLRFDVVFYVIMMALAFLLAGKLPEKGFIWRWRSVAGFLVLVLGVAIVLFTFLPPGGALFADLSGAATWANIPY